MVNDKTLLYKVFEKYENRRKQKEDLRSGLEFWKIFDIVDKVDYEPLYLNNIEDITMSDSFEILIEICEDLLGNLLFDNEVQIGEDEDETIIVLEYKDNIYRIIIDSFEGINTRIQRVEDKIVLYKEDKKYNLYELIEPIFLTDKIINDYVRYGNKPIEIKSLGFVINLFNGYRNMIGGKFSDGEKEVYEYVVRKLIENDGRGEM